MKKRYIILSVWFLLSLVAVAYPVWICLQNEEVLQKTVWIQRSLVLLPNSGFASDEENIVNAEERLRQSIIPFWDKKEALVSNRYQYVKYAKGYKTRAIVDFMAGEVIIETVDQKDPAYSLKSHAIDILLTPAPKDVDIYSDKSAPSSAEPFLYGQLEDAKGRKIYFGARATDYVEDELKKGLAEREITVKGISKTVRSLRLAMKKDHMITRAQKYLPAMRENSKRFHLPVRLLLAIAHVESSFNPFAVSNASAYGIMQVVPSSAGKEVSLFLKSEKRQPNKSFLLNFENNIKYGAAYLHILHNKYFSEIKNDISRELCAIAAYNGGPGAVLKAFGKNPESAYQNINKLSPSALFNKLTTIMPSDETRKYVEKVVKAMKNYKTVA